MMPKLLGQNLVAEFVFVMDNKMVASLIPRYKLVIVWVLSGKNITSKILSNLVTKKGISCFL